MLWNLKLKHVEFQIRTSSTSNSKRSALKEKRSTSNQSSDSNWKDQHPINELEFQIKELELQIKSVEFQIKKSSMSN